MTDLIEHLESFLGEMSGGSSGDDTTPPGVQVAWFPNAPFDGTTTLVTTGLSNHHLAQGDRGLHQELLMHVPAERQPPTAAGVLFQVAGIVLARGHGLLKGEVLGPYGRLFEEGEMTALIAFSPVYLPDEFAVCETPAPPVFLTWLVPITTGEARLVETRGWSALEDAFVADDPDLTSPLRPEVRF